MVEIVNCSSCGRLQAVGRPCPSCGDAGADGAADVLPADGSAPSHRAAAARPRGRRKGPVFHVMRIVLILIVVGAIAAVGLPVVSPGHHVSDREITKKVQGYLEQYLPTTPRYSDVRMTGTLALTPNGDGTYVGRVQATKGGTPITLTVDITCDSEQLVWRLR